jgi:hypothetical protein
MGLKNFEQVFEINHEISSNTLMKNIVPLLEAETEPLRS